MQDYSDEQLVMNYLKGDQKSLEFLIKRYLKPIYSFIYRYIGGTKEAEDIVQEVFVRMWRNMKKFDQRKSFKTWIFCIAKNASIDFFRESRLASGEKRFIPFSEFDDEEGNNVIMNTLADSAPLPTELLERADITNILVSALEKLSPKYRMVLFLRYNDHFTFKEIAESLGESLNTIKSRHRRALIILKKLLIDFSDGR